MPHRVRVTLLLAVAAFAFSAQTSQGGDPPPLYLTFDANGSLDVSLAGGTATPGGKPGSTVMNSDVVGSGLLPYRGSLAALVSATGKLSLTRDGKRVTSLKAGRYTITVVDRSVKAGFTLKKVTRGPLPLTSAAFVGRKSARLQLGA